MSSDYTKFITSEHQDKPNFAAMISLLAGSVGSISDTLASLPAKFDVDVAEGQQLDFVGQWVGASRRLTVPLDIYFSWDTAGRGWNQAVWQGPNDASSGLYYLDDNSFRLVIRCLIATDHWDGTLKSYQQIMSAILTPVGNGMYAVDHQDMTMSIVVTGPPLSLVLTAIVQNGILGLKPAGVAISSYAFPAAGGGPIQGDAKDYANASGKLN